MTRCILALNSVYSHIVCDLQKNGEAIVVIELIMQIQSNTMFEAITAFFSPQITSIFLFILIAQHKSHSSFLNDFKAEIKVMVEISHCKCI
jgi:hypothetical protein